MHVHMRARVHICVYVCMYTGECVQGDIKVSQKLWHYSKGQSLQHGPYLSCDRGHNL